MREAHLEFYDAIKGRWTHYRFYRTQDRAEQAMHDAWGNDPHSTKARITQQGAVSRYNRPEERTE